jgi:hypothetical protein
LALYVGQVKLLLEELVVLELVALVPFPSPEPSPSDDGLETLSPPPLSPMGHSHSELQLLEDDVLLLEGGSSSGD